MNITDVLQEKLLGNFYSVFRVGYAFDLYFNSFWLIANNVTSPDEIVLNKQVLNKYKPAIEAIDNKDIAKSITQVELMPDSSLELTFENEVKLLFPTDTEIVDWQWAINDDAQDPHNGFSVGVFASGEVLLGDC
ncbi:hypothetical protein NI379_06930 [Vibrio parahaemolyticus]|nr:hypothetical protein [Vibrio parahaemolyticus]WMO01781.1 hypothetical protein NI379_06930 [Vibrio parahaemolyticus]